MGDVTERGLSKLSRGVGTLSGNVQRETPVYIHESSDEYGLLQDASEKAFEEFILFQLKGQHATIHNSKEKREGKTLAAENVIHRTYSTKLGTLILYSDSLYLKEKKKKKLVKKEIKSAIEDVTFEGTVEDLTAYILRFGSDNFKFVSNASGMRDERLVSVRPGYSPIRYIASVSKLWKPDQVEKLVEEKALKEDHIRRYQKIKLPKVDIVPSSEYDPLLRSRPKPYSHISLPELLVNRGRVPSGVGKVHEAEGKIEDDSSGYARSLLSERKPFERKRITRKKTMQMKRLELHLPNEEPKRKSSKVEEPLKEEDVYDDETNDSLSDWGKLVETTRNVIDRTFENVLREKAIEEYGQVNGRQQMSDENKFGERINLERRFSSSTDSDEIALRGADYASLDQKEKEQVISHLLLKGIANEASTIESLMTVDNDDKASVYSENKIYLSEQISFPAIPNLPAVTGLDKTKGFRGNALHGSLPSANSSKSNQRTKTGSLKDGLVISSISKLPPIKSESVTPKVSQGNRDGLDGKGLKLPPIPRKGIASSTSAKKANIENEMNRDRLFIGGHAIEVADVHIHLEDDNMKQNTELSEDGYDDYNDSTDNGDPSLMDILRHKETGSQESLRGYEEVGLKSPPQSSLLEKDNSRYQTPDSGLSTATGLTLASDVNPVQNDHAVVIEPMTPLVEESSRSSKASKMLSREGTLNLTSSSIKRRAESVVSGSPKKREETQISMDLKMKERTLIEEKGEGALSPLQGRSKSEESAEVNRGVEIGQVSQDEEPDEVLNEKERSIGGILEGTNVEAENVSSENVVSDTIDTTTKAVEDEGVYMEEEARPVVEKDVTSTSKSELQCEDSKVSKLSDSVSASVELDGNFDDAKADSIVSRRSSGLLLAQAQTAAKSALSRPRSGFDIIEDMKVAADAFGKLFGEQIQRETNKPGSIHRGRTQSDAAQLSYGKRTLDKNRAASSLSTSAAKRMAPVDVNSLKATITSYESLHETKKSNSDFDEAPSRLTKDLEKESAADLEGDAGASDKSFPAGSSKSVPSRKSSPPKDMQMDIISYASVECDPKEVEVVVQKETSMLEQEAEIAREKTVDTEEERFAMALNEIVEEVKDLKEKKPMKKKKVRRSGRPTEEQNHIVRDIASVSPPFLTGRAKGGKAPKGLSNKEQDVSKAKGRKGKGKKGIKKVKVSKDKKPNKKVAVFEKEIDIKAKDEEKEIEGVESEMKEEAKEDVTKEELQVEETPEYDPNDKYDVPLTIKPAAKIPDPESEKETQDTSAEQVITVGEAENEDAKKNALGLRSDSLENYAKGASFVSSVGFETDEYAVVSSNDEGSDHRRRMDDRMKKRKLEAERRRLKVEQRRREKEDAKRKLQEQAEREERMRQEAELEMQRRIEEVKNRKKMEEDEKRMQEEAEQRRQRLLEREREREKREKEELKRKKAAMAAKLRLEEERRSEQERIARELEEERRRQEEELLKAMEDHERIEYERKKKEAEEERLKQEEERQRIEREKRLIEEEEHRIKMQKLQEFHQMLLERAKFWEGMKNSKWFLEINQRLTQAFTFSYFDLLPAMLFEFTSLRPFSSKENRFGLPTIYEETKGDDV